MHQKIRFYVAALIVALGSIGHSAGMLKPKELPMKPHDELVYAAIMGDEATIKKMLSQKKFGINQKLPSAQNGTIVHTLIAAVEHGYQSVNFNYLEASRPERHTARQSILLWMFSQKELNIDQEDEYGNTYLLCAATNNNHEAVKFLLERGAKINHKNSHSRTAVQLAFLNEAYESTKLLIAARAEISTDLAITIIHWACQMGHLDILTMLAKRLENVKGALEKSKNHKYSPLLWAIANKQVAIVKFLLEKKVPATQEDLEECEATIRQTTHLIRTDTMNPEENLHYEDLQKAKAIRELLEKALR
jgi:hypothetical protein